MNYTEISHCEVGTALGGSGGRPYYGANLSGKYDYPSSCKNNVISVSGFCAGGITGYNTKGVYRWTTKGNEDGTYTNLTDGGTITYCVNAAEVDGGTSIAKECGAGGIAGLMNGGYSESNRSEIGYCYNAGNVNAASSLAVGNAGGLVGSMDSWMIPFLILFSIGIEVIYNFGTNFVVGDVSYITKALAAVLQLGVTMDLSIFLMNAYKEQQQYYGDHDEAMRHAIVKTSSAITASALTLMAGFLAMCFMRI